MTVHISADVNLGSQRRAPAMPALLVTLGATTVSAFLALAVSIGKTRRADDLAALALSSIGDAGVLSA